MLYIESCGEVTAVMDVFNLNSMIENHCIRITILSENALSAYDFTKYIYYFMIYDYYKSNLFYY